MKKTMVCMSWAVAFVVLSAMGGCSSSSDTSGTPTGGSGGAAGSSGSAGSAGLAGSSGSAGEADADVSDALQAGTIAVTYNNNTVVVTVAQAPLMQDGGAAYSLASDVILLAIPNGTIANLAADFVGSDNYDPATKPSCSSFAPVAGASLAQGWIDRSTHDLSWDPALGLPGCMNVKDVAKIVVTDH